MWMPNSGNEARRMWLATAVLKDQIDYVSMDSKANSYRLYRELHCQRRITLVTTCQRKEAKTNLQRTILKS